MLTCSQEVHDACSCATIDQTLLIRQGFRRDIIASVKLGRIGPNDNPGSSQYWEYLRNNAEEVSKWPAWMRGAREENSRK